MIGYKGFDKNLKCKDLQYEVGKTVEVPEAELCRRGLHFCEYPLDVLAYYSPADSRFCTVEADDVTDEKENGDTKRVAKKLTVTAEIGLAGLIKAGVAYIKEQVDWENAKKSNDKNRSAATNTGYRSAATNTGDMSAATNTGDMSAATNTGDRSAATNTGDRSAATNTGYMSAATNTGDMSAATNTGDMSAATNTGYMSAATNTGDRSAATNTGYMSAAIVEGKESVACALGLEGKAKGALGCWLVLSEWDYIDGEWHRVSVKAFKVDGKKIKPDTFYMLKDGKAVKVE